MARLQSCAAAQAEGDRKRAKRLLQEGLNSQPSRGTRATPPIQRTGRLAARKQEIALPVGRGLTNRQIAQELSISERTAENHVGRILKKLGLHSRAVIAAWVAQSKHSPHRK